ncbi:MAG: sigma-70 family RNA polymerase sigma factor [Candidatus Cloacimonetes bacterium]|nr:sigma-70 family RNA polymerase sigma factor [Candidatus Cloacimonadota bacterium]
MEKEKADKIITDYMKKIYGFALSKTMDIDQAEDLTSKIIFEVYTSLLKVEQVYNVNSYIYRISNNVFASFLNEIYSSEQHLAHFNHTPIYEEENKDEIYARLRGEIAYLSKHQREIVVMHYFQKLRLTEIAKRLNLSQGTVRWHLFEARNQIKDNIKNKDNLLRSNVESTEKQKKIFTNMKQFGQLSIHGIDMEFFFSNTISQNIAYSAYHIGKSSIEIAKELSVPVAFVEDEIHHLVENGFMEKMPNNKYQTNIYINEINLEQEEKIKTVLLKYVKIISDKYIPLLLDRFKNYRSIKNTNIYSPHNDFNFLMWSIITYSCWKMFYIEDISKDLSEFMVKQKKGGKNIAIASVSNNMNASNKSYQSSIDIMLGMSYHQIKVWQFFSDLDDRKYQNIDSIFSSIDILNDLINNQIINEPANVNKLLKLLDRDYIVPKKNRVQNNGSSEYVNNIVTTNSEEKLKELFPAVPKEMISISKELDAEIFKINKKYKPQHKQDLCRVMCKNVFSSGQFRVHIMEHLLKTGILKPLKKYQRKTVNMIIFTN